MKKLLLSLLLGTAVSSIAYATGGNSSVSVNGNSYTNINKVYIGPNGRIIFLFSGGGGSANASDFPSEFLASWNINKASQQDADLERAIKSGNFREVDGVVYDIRRAESGWAKISRAKIIQILDDGAIVDLTPDNYQIFGAHIRNLPRGVGDTDFITVSAKLVGNYSYINQENDDRTIRDYDCGKICSRDEIPDSVLNGQKAFASAPLRGAPNTDILATLPESDSLKASGSGFFVSEDGYLITNFHVIRGAKRVKIKQGLQTYDAEIVKTDKMNDLAALKIAGKFRALPISKNGREQLGAAVFTIGFPNIDLQGTAPKYTDGKISSLTGLKDDPRRYQISVPVQPGNSGGPLVDESGNIVGVVVAKLSDFAALRISGDLPQNVNYAIKGQYLRDFLSELPNLKLTNEQNLSATNLVESVQASVAMILVY
jgi:S1-C subfamily serine protease